MQARWDMKGTRPSRYIAWFGLRDVLRGLLQ
jgi:hypothetical protein